MTKLDAALAKETAARLGADAAQDKVIQQVNDNLVTSVNTINESVKTTNENMAAGFTALSQTDANEAATREAKDTELNERITAEANAIHETTNQLQSDLTTETTERKTADNELNERITNEANAIHETTNKLQSDLTTETTAREAADTALDTRITNVKEYLEKQTSDNYVSKTDAAVEDGAIVKKANTIGENVALLDKGLADETAARLGADAAQDKVIKQVNDNLVSSVDAINKNMAAGFNALSQADANELAGRVAADTKLAEAVNGGLSLSDNNVLQKNIAKVNSDGTVSTSKEAATTLVMNEGKENQITLSENGVKVGTNSSVMDANGVYTGGDDYDAAQAAMSADGKIKGANGKFTVDTDGNVASGNVTSTGTVKGATLTDGTATISNGNIKTNGGFIQTGGGNVNTQGGEVRTNGGKVATSGGEINTGSGNIKTVGGDILTAGGKLNTSGGDIVAGTGNISGQNITASGVLSGDSLTVAKGMTGHSLTLTGGDLDAGAGTIKTTGKVEAGTLTTTGDATIGGNLTVDKNLTVNGEFNAETLSSKLDENNYTEIHGGNVTSVNSKVDITDGKTYTSTSTLTEKGKTETASNGINRNVEKMDATESSDVITNDANGQTSTFRQKIDQILQEIKASDTAYSKVDQAMDSITSTVTDGTNTTSVEQGNQNITNTAEQGTISNIAKDLVNTATGDMTNTVGGKMLNNVTGDMENKVGGNLTTTVGGNETHTVSGTLTETVTSDVTEDYKANLSTTVGGSQTTTVTGDSSLTAENITNEARNKITNKALDVETDASSSIVNKVSNDAGSNTSTQLSYQTTEEMSQADGKKASYLRGAAEEKSQLTDGDKKTTIDTIAGQTNTNITDGTNTSNSLQKADQAASSVTDGTNTTVVNQDATSLASSITDGTKANNTNSTVDKSEQLIKASDTQYSASVKTATASAERLVSGNIIDILKDAENGYVNTTVTSSDGASRTSVQQGTAEITNTATTSIKDVVGKSTVTTTDTGTTFENSDHAAAIGEGSITKTTISGNTLETGKVTADYVDVNKDLTVKGDSDLQGKVTVGKDLNVKGSTKLDGTLEVAGKSTFKDDVTMEKNLDVKGTTTTDKLVVNNGATITGGTTTDTLHVTNTATFDGMVTFKDAVSMEKDLSVGGNATVTGDVTAKSYKVGNKTYINENGINANGQKITNVADGTIAKGSTDAVNGGQLNATNQRVTTVENRMDGVENRMDRVENRVDNLDNRIDKVGASAAAMANLHPMDFDEDSKVSVAAAMGSYRSETAGALGVFYRPTDRVMLNVSTSFGNGENMVGGGVSFKLGKSSKRLAKAEATNAALAKQVTNLQNRLDALLGVLNPSLSKDFPDVPANHWAYEAVSRLAGNDIVQGYEDGKYHGERTMTRYEMAEIIYNALSKGAKAEAKLVEEFRPELQAMAAQRKA